MSHNSYLLIRGLRVDLTSGTTVDVVVTVSVSVNVMGAGVVVAVDCRDQLC